MGKQPSFLSRDIISVNELSKKDIIRILDVAKIMEKNKKPLLNGKVLATLFFEPSTRTRLSFESSMNKLGGKVIGFRNPNVTSFKKGETLWDAINVIEGYSDVIVIRHPMEGAARLASEAAEVPVINAGDGANQHPTQTLLDLYTIKKSQGKITGLKVAIAGDLKYGRTVHSLAHALGLFNCELFFVSPKSLKMPDYIKDDLKEKQIKFSEHEKVSVVIDEADILYATRIQKERFPDPTEYEKVKNAYVIDSSLLKKVKKNLKIMHPLPRVNEIDISIDESGYAYFFEQAHNGIPVRKAILSLVLGKIK
ncbi:aspartate carbamoyltransferase [Candidatus Woesearchaeota archaeon]|nr:aspartate carbamoyltransferase [Candidatus Woesearchaeota archaeon]